MRSAMRAASQLPGKGPTDVDDAPAPAHLNKKSDYIYISTLKFTVKFCIGRTRDNECLSQLRLSHLLTDTW